MERTKRRWWTRGITWLSLIAITGALVSGLFQLAVTLAPGYRDEIAQRATAAVGQPVVVDGLALRWRWLWPLLELNGVRLLDADRQHAVIAAERVRLAFDLGGLVRGEWIPAQVDVLGATVATEITPEGRWRLIGQASERAPPAWAEVARALARFARLKAERLTVSVLDRRLTPAVPASVLLQKGDLRLDDTGFELRTDWQAPEVIAARLRLRAGMTGPLAEPQRWQGRWTLDASGFAPQAPLHRLLPALTRLRWTDATVTAAGDWTPGALGASELGLRARFLAIDGEPASLAQELDLGLHYRPSATGGTVDVVPLRLVGQKGAWPASTARIEWQQAQAGAPRQWRAGSDFLRLDDLSPWLALVAESPREGGSRSKGESASLAALLRSLRGDVTATEARWQHGEGSPRYRVSTRVAGFAAALDRRGSVKGLDATLTLDEQGGRASVSGKGVAFALPGVLEGSHRAERVAAEADWQREGPDPGGWRLRLPQFSWALSGSEGQGSAELQLPAAGGPRLALNARFDVADAAALKPLMPLHWGASLKTWLDRAVVRARISKAVLELDGPLADFPYHRQPTGRFSLLLPVSGARLEYHRDWPGVDQLAATVKLVGNGLTFETQRGVISGVAVREARGGIADFATAPLVLDGVTLGEGPAYYAFLRGSPLATRLAALLTRSEAAGEAETRVHLEIPLHSVLGQKTIARGTVQLLGNQLQHAALDAPVTDIRGSLSFGDGPGVSAESLSGTLMGTPLTARISPGTQGSDTLQARARIAPARDDLAAAYVPRWLRGVLDGAADFELALPLGGPDAGRARLSSTLEGVAVALPEPFDKPAAARWPLVLTIGSEGAVPLAITGELESRLGLALRFARPAPGRAPELRGVALRVGPGAAEPLPMVDGLRLGGSVARLDPLAWRGAALALKASRASTTAASIETLPLLGATLAVGELQLGGYATGPVTLTLRREYGASVLRLAGEGSQGLVQIASDGQSILARLTRLELTPLPKVDPPGPSGGPAAAAEPLDPAKAPVLDAAVDRLVIGGRSFGAAALQSERMAGGQRLKRMSVEGGIATLAATGEWRRSQGMTEAQSRFTVTSDDLAGTLAALGFAPTLAGRNARIEGDLTWPAAVRGFDWVQGRGNVGLMVEDGALRTVEPGGTSRVLGLFNFYALPRRLTLDFGDVVSKGLAFNRAEGRFTLTDGVARTADLTVRGPSLKIAVNGAVGLAARDYDQIITVTPNTQGITLGALLLGGATAVTAPILPVLAVIANQVLDKPVGQATQLTYRLTGSWDNPEIRKLDGSRPAAAETDDEEIAP